MSITADIDRAVEEIVNEAIVQETDEKIVELNLNSLNYPDNIKAIILWLFFSRRDINDKRFKVDAIIRSAIPVSR